MANEERMRRPVLLVTLSVLTLSGLSLGALAATGSPGRVGPSFSTTGNGRSLWTVDSGHSRDDVQVVDVASGRVRQVLPLPGIYGNASVPPLPGPGASQLEQERARGVLQAWNAGLDPALWLRANPRGEG